MEYYLLKYRVTTANVIANTIETYSSQEDAEAKYYENLLDATTNNRLKYVMLSVMDSEGRDIIHNSITSPGEIPEENRYYLVENTLKTDNTIINQMLSFSSLEEASAKLLEDETSAAIDNTITRLKSVILDINGNVSKTSEQKGGGYLNYKGKYLLFVNKMKTDETLVPTVNRYDSLDAVTTAVYRLLSDCIDDPTLLYIIYKVENAFGDTIQYEKKKCIGEIPPAPEPEPEPEPTPEPEPEPEPEEPGNEPEENNE